MNAITFPLHPRDIFLRFHSDDVNKIQIFIEFSSRARKSKNKKRDESKKRNGSNIENEATVK